MGFIMSGLMVYLKCKKRIMKLYVLVNEITINKVLDSGSNISLNISEGKLIQSTLNILAMLSLASKVLDLNFLKLRGFFGNIHVGLGNLKVSLEFFRKARSLKGVQLMDIVCIDLMALHSDIKRFELVYILMSPLYNVRFFLHKYIKLFEVVDSVTSLYTTAD